MLGITTSEVKLVQFEKKLLKSLILLTFKLLQVVKLVQPVNLTTWFFIVTLLAVVKPGGIQLVALVIPLPNVLPLISLIPLIWNIPCIFVHVSGISRAIVFNEEHHAKQANRADVLVFGIILTSTLLNLEHFEKHEAILVILLHSVSGLNDISATFEQFAKK